MDIGSILGLGAVFALVALNGFFVAAEFAMVSVRRSRIEQLVAEGSGAARILHKAITRLNNYIAATQLGITLASLALGWIGEPTVANLVVPPLELILPQGEAADLSHTVAIIISFILITMFHIVLGELVPKTVALQRTEAVALFIARPLELFRLTFRPFISVINFAGRTVVRLFGMEPIGEIDKVHSVEELEVLVTESRVAGLLDQDEETLLHRVFDFGDKAVRQIMIPRTEIVGVSHEATFDQLIALAAQERYTRYPVYQGSMDKIMGVIHVKDLFGVLQTGSASFRLQQIVRPVITVPETVHVTDLLTLMRSRQVHIAVLIDEYGGTAGIVTLEDIVEEIVGDLRDEFDTQESGAAYEFDTQADGSILVSGLYSLSELSERLGLPTEQAQLDDYDSLGGYIQGQLDRIPIAGDVLTLGHYSLQVEQMDGLRVDRVSFTPVASELKVKPNNLASKADKQADQAVIESDLNESREVRSKTSKMIAE